MFPHTFCLANYSMQFASKRCTLPPMSLEKHELWPRGSFSPPRVINSLFLSHPRLHKTLSCFASAAGNSPWLICMECVARKPCCSIIRKIPSPCLWHDMQYFCSLPLVVWLEVMLGILYSSTSQFFSFQEVFFDR